MTNLGALLAVIRHSEGTDLGGNPYAVVFGNKFTISDFSDHPAVLGTWRGEPLDFLGPQYAGEISTAAGAYQIIKPTWISLKRGLNLPDFSPASQDAAATELIREVGALRLINAGQAADAISRCRDIWASLPGSVSGQPQAKMADLLNFYVTSGGAFA